MKYIIFFSIALFIFLGVMNQRTNSKPFSTEFTNLQAAHFLTIDSMTLINSSSQSGLFVLEDIGYPSSILEVDYGENYIIHTGRSFKIHTYSIDNINGYYNKESKSIHPLISSPKTRIPSFEIPYINSNPNYVNRISKNCYVFHFIPIYIFEDTLLSLTQCYPPTTDRYSNDGAAFLSNGNSDIIFAIYRESLNQYQQGIVDYDGVTAEKSCKIKARDIVTSKLSKHTEDEIMNSFIGKFNNDYLYHSLNYNLNNPNSRYNYVVFSDSTNLVTIHDEENYHSWFKPFLSPRIGQSSVITNGHGDLLEFRKRSTDLSQKIPSKLNSRVLLDLNISTGMWRTRSLHELKGARQFDNYSNSVLRILGTLSKPILIESWENINGANGESLYGDFDEIKDGVVSMEKIMKKYLLKEWYWNKMISDSLDDDLTNYELISSDKSKSADSLKLWKYASFAIQKPIYKNLDFLSVSVNWIDENKVTNNYIITAPNIISPRDVFINDKEQVCIWAEVIPTRNIFEVFTLEDRTNRGRLKSYRVEFLNQLKENQSYYECPDDFYTVSTAIVLDKLSSKVDESISQQNKLVLRKVKKESSNDDHITYIVCSESRAEINNLSVYVTEMTEKNDPSRPDWAKEYWMIVVNGYISVYVPKVDLLLFNNGDTYRGSVDLEEAVNISLRKYYSIHYGIENVVFQ